MYKGVIFDLDDTLYDYSSCNEAATKKLSDFCTLQFGITHDEFRNLLSQAKIKVKRRLGDVAASHSRMLYMQIFSELIGVNAIEYSLSMYDLYWDTMLENMRLFDFVIPFLDYLKENKVKVGILSDLTACIQHRKIRKLEITPYIDSIVTSEETGCEKPSKDMFALILEKMSLNAEDVIMIGDSLKKDVKGAGDFGIRGVLASADIVNDRSCKILKQIMNER